MKATRAYANKLIRKLKDDKVFWENKEENTCVYTAATDEEPVIPAYSYSEVSGKIAEIDERILSIRHALNVNNASNRIQVGERTMTVDMILIRMAQLNNRKYALDTMRKREPKTRRDARMSAAKKSVIEYEYVNYDLETVKADYEKLTAELEVLQLALDKYNQTVEIEI